MIKVRVRVRKDRGLEMVWKDTAGIRRSRKCKAESPRDAEREAAILEAKFNEGKEGSPLLFYQLMDRARKDMYPFKSHSYTRLLDQAASIWGDLFGYRKDVNEITQADIARFREALRGQVCEETIRTYLRHLRVLFRWGGKAEIIHRVPKIEIGASKRSDAVRKKTVDRSAFDSILKACRECRPHDYKTWLRFIEGMWFSGLRLNEALTLSWDEGPFQVDLTTAKYPMFRILSEGQKSRRDELLPMTPDFHRWLISVSHDRKGSVFGMSLHRNKASAMASKILTAAIGDRTTAHDLRRSFGTRWAMKVKPAILMKLMRHASIETTMKYYVILDAEDIAQSIWES